MGSQHSPCDASHLLADLPLLGEKDRPESRHRAIRAVCYVTVSVCPITVVETKSLNRFAGFTGVKNGRVAEQVGMVNGDDAAVLRDQREAERLPGGDVPKADEDPEYVVEEPGRRFVSEKRWIPAWRDEAVSGQLYDHYGISVGLAETATPTAALQEATS